MKKEPISKADKYCTDIFDYLDRLPAGMVSIPKICKRENMEKFLKICDEYVKERGDINEFWVYLNKKRDTLHKFDRVLKETYE